MTTFAVTFLGHQGWVVRSARACVLVDPLLCEDFGQAQQRVYPPRVFRPDAFPAIDAVILSHEHDDHFDIPSLAQLERRIPILLSAHSSIAAYKILTEMGFTVRPLLPGVPLDVGDLQIVPFCGDHVSVNCADEWDALPFLIRERSGAGSFFSMVDVQMLQTHVEWAKAFAPRPGLVSWTNNALDWSHMAAPSAGDDAATEQCLTQMDADHELIATAWGKPSATLTCAGGFSFHGDQAWLNERVFTVDTEAVCEKLRSVHRDQRFFSTLPGQTFWMTDNRLQKVDESAPFVGVAPRAQWPARQRSEHIGIPDYSPATGRPDLRDADGALLRDALNELAAALMGGLLFRSLHSMLAVETAGLRPTFALVLRYGASGAAHVFEYDATACTFLPGAAADPRRAYLAGWECWATDLLAVLHGELPPVALMFGRARMWNALPRRFRFDLLEGLCRTSHPLRRPADYLRTYERAWDTCKTVTPTIRGRSGG